MSSTRRPLLTKAGLDHPGGEPTLDGPRRPASPGAALRVATDWKLYAFLFTLITVNYGDRVALSIGAKDISQEFHLGPVQLGYVFSSFSWAYLVFLLPWGSVADRVGPKLSSSIGMALWSLATIATGLAGSVTTLLAARLAMGAGEASSFPACGRLIRTWLPRRQYGIANMVVISGGYAGPAAGAVAFAWLASRLGWRGGFVILGLTGFVWIGLAALFLRQGGRGPNVEKVADESTTAGTLGGGFTALLASPSLWGLFLTQGANVYSHYLFLTWLPNYLQTTRSLSTMSTGLFTGLPFALSVVFSLSLSLVSDRMLPRGKQSTGHRKWFVAAMMLLSATIGLLPFVDGIWIVVAILTVSLTGTSAATGLNSALLTDLLVSPSDAGKAHSLFVFGGNLFGAVAPIVTGYIRGRTGSFDAAWWFCAAFLLLGACTVASCTRHPIGQ